MPLLTSEAGNVICVVIPTDNVEKVVDEDRHCVTCCDSLSITKDWGKSFLCLRSVSDKIRQHLLASVCRFSDSVETARTIYDWVADYSGVTLAWRQRSRGKVYHV